MDAPETATVRDYTRALAEYIADPVNPRLRAEFFLARDRLAILVKETGRPAEDIRAGLQFRLSDGGRNLIAEPLYLGRFSGWAADGALSVAPAYGRRARHGTRNHRPR